MELSSLDPELQRIVQHINKIREAQFACSVNDVATATRLNKSTAYRRLGELREMGCIEWTDGIAGSVRSLGALGPQQPDADWKQTLRDSLEAELEEPTAFVDWLLDQLDSAMYPQPTESD
jgi:DNA-binding transcriptional regulator YhcF (GntR family)